MNKLSTENMMKKEPVMPAGRSIGAILIDTGKLSIEDAERILQLQKIDNLRFGDAAISLGLLTHADVQYALARQYDYPYLLKDEGAVSGKLVAAYSPYSPQVEILRTLRSQLMLRRFTGAPNRKMLSIISPSRGEGRSFLAANLAIVFSQLGERTLLIDADMRHPCQHELFKLDNRFGLSTLLAGRGSDMQPVQRVNNFVDLSVLTSGPIPPNPQELFGRPELTRLLSDLNEVYDVILIDTSAATDFADAHIVTARAGAAIVLARKNHTQLELVTRQTESLGRSGVEVIGTVLNEF